MRFYERAGLVPDPDRSTAGYRLYNPDHESRLLSTTREHVDDTIDTNLADIAIRITELERFAAELRDTRTRLATGPVCDPDLGCCPPAITAPVPVTLNTQRRP